MCQGASRSRPAYKSDLRLSCRINWLHMPPLKGLNRIFLSTQDSARLPRAASWAILSPSRMRDSPVAGMKSIANPAA